MYGRVVRNDYHAKKEMQGSWVVRIAINRQNIQSPYLISKPVLNCYAYLLNTYIEARLAC
jgi:hypothetical protein